MPTQEFYPFPEASKDEWLDQIKHDLKGKVELSALKSKLWEEIQIDPIYSFEQVEGSPVPNSFNTPSKFPGLPTRIWSNVVAPSMKDEKATNEEILEVLQLGAEGLVLQLNGTEDLNVILKGVFTEFVTLHFMPINEMEPVLIQVKNWAESLQLTPEMLHGSILWSPTGSMFTGKEDLTSEINLGIQMITEFKEFPHFLPITIDLARYSNAGGSGIQELSYGLSEVIEILDQFSQKGISVNQAMAQLAFHSAVGENHFPEIVKLKVLRSLLVDLTTNLGGNITSESIHLIASTSVWSKSLLDTNTSLVRQSYEAMAAIIGGCNTLWVRPMEGNEASPLAKRIARNVSTILREESFLDKVMDPASGAYFLESLATEIESNVIDSLKEIEEKGGWETCFSDRSIHVAIQQTARKTQKAILKKDKSMIGVNKYELKSNDSATLNLEKPKMEDYELPSSRASYLVEIEKSTQG